MAVFEKIGGKPGEKKISAIEEAAISARDVPHIGRTENIFPRHRRARFRINRCIDRAIRAAAAYVSQLSLVDSFVLFRTIAVKRKESGGPGEPNQSENVKNRAPPKSNHDIDCHERRCRHCKPAETVRDAVHEPSFGLRKPQLHGSGGDGKRACLAQSKNKAGNAKRNYTCRQSCKNNR